MPARASRAAAIVSLVTMALSACASSAPPVGSETPSPSASASVKGTARATTVATPTSDAVTLDGTPAPKPQPPGEAPITAAPAAGLYRYAQEGRGVFGDYPNEGTLRIRAATLADGGQRQRQVRTISDDQMTESTYVFTSKGVLLEQLTQRVGSGAFAQTVTCTLEPAIRIVRFPVKMGAAWDGASTCQGLDISFEASFLREQRLTIGGTQVDAIVLKATFEARGDGFEQTTVTTSWISLDHRLVVRSTEKSSGRQGAVEYSTSLTEMLLSLEPA